MTEAVVEILLGSISVRLVPSLKAVETLSTDKGLGHLAERCRNLEFAAIKQVIVTGMGLTGNGAKELPELLYKAGLANLAPLCLDYLTILANGGQLPPTQAKTGE